MAIHPSPGAQNAEEARAGLVHLANEPSRHGVLCKNPLWVIATFKLSEVTCGYCLREWEADR